METVLIPAGLTFHKTIVNQGKEQQVFSKPKLLTATFSQEDL